MAGWSQNRKSICAEASAWMLFVLQRTQPVLFLCKLRLGSVLVGSELFKGFRFCYVL